jgi:Uma2 family endonuclease
MNIAKPTVSGRATGAISLPSALFGAWTIWSEQPAGVWRTPTTYYVGSLSSDDMDFVEGPPTFVVEVRSKGDDGGAAEAAMAAKRADYFQAGAKVVWDVDPRLECIRVYRADTPYQPVVFHKDQQADAEPAVPGWRLVVDEIFCPR